MRIVALGDAHLGRNYLSRTTAGGLNQREVDFEESFEAAVALGLAQDPELVVWLGDIFDHPRPTYRSFRVARRALATIREHGVPVVVISGNHDTPRLPGTGSPYSVLSDEFRDVHFAHRMQYERFEIGGDLVVHAVPQMLTVEATKDALEEADRSRSLDHPNLLITHPRVPQVEPRYADINEIEVDAGLLRGDVVLLGHYHFHVQVAPRIWYAGSTDTFTFADDPDKAKGIVVLDTTSGEIRHVALEGQRPLVTLERVEARGMTHHELSDAVLARVAAIPAGAVARLFVDEVDPETFRLLDLDRIREAAAAALDLKLTPTFAGVSRFEALPELGSMPARWDGYLEGQDLAGFDRDRIRTLGREYLAAAVEESSGSC